MSRLFENGNGYDHEAGRQPTASSSTHRVNGARARASEEVVEGFATLLKTGDASGVTSTYVATRLDELARTAPPKPGVPVGVAAGGIAMISGLVCVLAVLGTALLYLDTPLSPSEEYQRWQCWIPAVSLTSFFIFWVTAAIRRAYERKQDELATAFPATASGQIKVVLSELETLHSAAAAAVKAKNDYGHQLINHATTVQRLEVEQNRLDAQLAGARRSEEMAQARHSTALGEEQLRTRKSEFDQAVARSAASDIDRVRAEAADTIAQARAAAAEEVATVKAAVAEQLAASSAQADQAITRARQEAALARGTTHNAVAAARKLTQQLAAAEEAREKALSARDERGAESEQLRVRVGQLDCLVDELRAQLDRVQAPAAVRARARQSEIETEKHRVELQKLGAEAARHQSEARRLLKGEETPLEKFRREASERFTKTTDKQGVFDDIKRQTDAWLSEVANTHGEASEAYQDADTTFTVMLNELRQEVNQ